MKPNKETFIQIWNNQYSLQAFVLAVLLFIIDLAAKSNGKTEISNVLGLLIFSLVFTAFDVTGWWGIVKTLSLEYPSVTIEEDNRQKTAMASYRIMQSTLHIILLGFICVYWSWIVVVACIVSWWFLADDLLYYALCREKLSPNQEINWVNWSVWIIPKTLHTDCKLYGTGFVIFGVVGFLLGIFICVWRWNV